METDVVAGVKAGRRILDCRRRVLFSSSATLRLGDEWDDCEVSPFRRSVHTAEVLRRGMLSFTEEPGREADIPVELLLEAPFDPGVMVPCLPLPVCGIFRGFVGLETTPFIAAPLPLRNAALEGDLRLAVGDGWWPFGILSGGRSKALRMFSTAEGIGMVWTVLTAGQSANGTLSTSSAHGGRQQPGQPGLLYPVFVGGGT